MSFKDSIKVKVMQVNNNIYGDRGVCFCVVAGKHFAGADRSVIGLDTLPASARCELDTTGKEVASLADIGRAILESYRNTADNAGRSDQVLRVIASKDLKFIYCTWHHVNPDGSVDDLGKEFSDVRLPDTFGTVCLNTHSDNAGCLYLSVKDAVDVVMAELGQRIATMEKFLANNVEIYHRLGRAIIDDMKFFYPREENERADAMAGAIWSIYGMAARRHIL